MLKAFNVIGVLLAALLIWASGLDAQPVLKGSIVAALISAILFLVVAALILGTGRSIREVFDTFRGKANYIQVAMGERVGLIWFLLRASYEFVVLLLIVGLLCVSAMLVGAGIPQIGAIVLFLDVIGLLVWLARRYRNEKIYWELQVLHGNLALRTVQGLWDVNGKVEPDVMATKILKHCIDALQSGRPRRSWGGWRAAILLPEDNSLRVRFGIAAPGGAIPSSKYASGKSTGEFDTLAWKAWKMNTTLLSKWATLDKMVDQNYSDFQRKDHPFVIRSLACTPIGLGEKHVGILSIDHNWPMMVKDTDRAVLAYYGRMLGIVLSSQHVEKLEQQS